MQVMLAYINQSSVRISNKTGYALLNDEGRGVNNVIPSPAMNSKGRRR